MIFSLVTAIATTVPEAAQPTSDMDFTGLFIKMIALLLVIVIMGFILIRYVGHSAKLRGKGSGAHFELVSWYRLEPKKTVYLLKIGGRLFAIGAAESNLNLISEIGEGDLKV